MTDTTTPVAPSPAASDVAGAITGAGPSANGISRRNLLVIGAVGASAVTLAACSQAKSPDTVDAGSATAGSSAGSSSAGASSAGSASASGSSSASASAGGGSAQSLAKLSSIKVGGSVAATGPDGAKIIISRPTESTVAAFSAICTHQGCAVTPANGQLDCPCHGSVFNATTGAVITGPANQPLPAVNVKISGEDVIPG